MVTPTPPSRKRENSPLSEAFYTCFLFLELVAEPGAVLVDDPVYSSAENCPSPISKLIPHMSQIEPQFVEKLWVQPPKCCQQKTFVSKLVKTMQKSNGCQAR
ncbi:hypothetical protein AVEN_211387-1 [Araneus ventricosus]|uniref:Uncharacterized protein n=1 Tax=Araneus ventricosus TaxID=182803 RepID=A0A4Y2AGI1_ARAVE|nr:hypothetical protein AVEN_211387-1 [Araneus ventricosus]